MHLLPVRNILTIVVSIVNEKGKLVMPPKLPPVASGEFRRPSMNPQVVALVAALLVILIVLFTSYYTVNPEEVGVVQRFGRALPDLAQPGLHFKLPMGIDRVTKVPVLRQMKDEFGFATTRPGVQSEFRGPKDEARLLEQALMVTGDLNMSVVEWIIQYRINDPKAYLFNMRNPDKTLRDATESVMREVVGDRTVDEVLTFGRQGIEQEVFTRLQQLVTSYAMGIRIDQVVLQGVTPPAQVEASFNEVNQAQQEREKMINLARSDYNKVVPRAKGEALQKIQEAEGYATKRVNEAQGDATRFTSMLTAYLKAPEVTRRRIFLETMGDVIPRLGRKVIIDSDVQQLLPLLSLDANKQEVSK